MGHLMDLPYKIRRQILFYALLPEIYDACSVTGLIAARPNDLSCRPLFVRRQCARTSRYFIDYDEAKGYWGTETITMLMCICRRLHAEIEEICYSEFSFFLHIEQIPLFISVTTAQIHSSIKHLDLAVYLSVEIVDKSPVLAIDQSRSYLAWSLLRRNLVNIQSIICRVDFFQGRPILRDLRGYRMVWNFKPCSMEAAVDLTMKMLRYWKDVPSFHVELLNDLEFFYGRQDDDGPKTTLWMNADVIEECASLARSGQW